MNGTMVVLDPGQIRMVKLTAPPELETLQQAVGGYIEAVPGFTSISATTIRGLARYLKDAPSIDDLHGAVHALGVERINCVALCNEDGKRDPLSRNDLADILWLDAWRHDSHMRKYGRASPRPDYLVGTVVVFFGDREFMASL